jgi:Zn-dependent protease
VNYSALKNPKRDMMLVAAAGPASNLVMALGWAVLYKLGDLIGPGDYATPLKLMSIAGIEVNMVLMLLNLLPILPLDGGRIVAGLLPSRMSWQYAKTEPWGFPILLLLMFSGLLGVLLAPMVKTSFRVIGAVFRF